MHTQHHAVIHFGRYGLTKKNRTQRFEEQSGDIGSHTLSSCLYRVATRAEPKAIDDGGPQRATCLSGRHRGISRQTERRRTERGVTGTRGALLTNKLLVCVWRTTCDHVSSRTSAEDNNCWPWPWLFSFFSAASPNARPDNERERWPVSFAAVFFFFVIVYYKGASIAVHYLVI